MRALLIVALALALVTFSAPGVAASPWGDDGPVDPDCFNQLARPYEDPVEGAGAFVYVALCLVTG